MPKIVKFDYFYGGESEQFSYYRIPRLLVTGTQFKNLSTDAKLLYGLMLDRMSLSAKNGWYDRKGRVYIYYSMDEVMSDLNCVHDKALKLLADLDSSKGIGLIERVKQGQGKPTIIYVKQFTSRAIPSPATDEPTNGEFAAIAAEIAQCRFHAKGVNRTYNREESELDAESVSCILCKRFGIQRDLPNLENLTTLYEGWEPQEARQALTNIQEMSKQIGNSIERDISPKQHSRASMHRSAR